MFRKISKSLLILMLVFLLTSVVAFSCGHTPGPFDEERWRQQVMEQQAEQLYAPHFKDGQYFNPWMPMDYGGFGRLLKWKLAAKAFYSEEEKNYRPQFIPDLKQRLEDLPEGDFIAWVGHATFLMRLQGEYWLTDPMFSERALLPKRITPPALTGEELGVLCPRVNVMISHNHYDHLDAATIRSLPRESRFFVPLGLREYIASLHPGEVRELDWWQEVTVGGGRKLVCLPAQHWSRRIGQGFNETLWASFLLITPHLSLYYGGDSGYFVGYKEIGRRFPKIDYALIATTAYHPRWFMHYAHKSIPEALDAFHDLGAEYFIPTQWGTFPLGDEPPGYPGLDLTRTIEERNLDRSRYILMNIGEIRLLEGGSRPASADNGLGHLQAH